MRFAVAARVLALSIHLVAARALAQLDGTAGAAAVAGDGDDRAEPAPTGLAIEPREAYGPLPSRVVHPFFMPFYTPVSERARTIGRGRLGLLLHSRYASVQRSEQDGRSISIYDGEFLRLSLTARYGILEDLEVSLELPFYTSGSGFLDGTIKGFHNSTGLSQDLRRNFLYREVLIVDGRPVLDEDPHTFALADIPLQLKYELLEDGVDPFGLAFRAVVEFPAGDESAWVGNGGLDGGVGFLLEKRYRDFSAYLNADFRFLSRPGKLERAHLELEPVPSATFALEWRTWRYVGFLAQLDFSANPFDTGRNPDLELLDHPQLELSAALLFRLPGRFFGFAGLSEDLIHVSSPDVTFFFGIGTNAIELSR